MLSCAVILKNAQEVEGVVVDGPAICKIPLDIHALAPPEKRLKG